MTYSEALLYLSESRRFGMKLGLDPMRRVARELGSPESRLRFIHLAGTNGKGSTAAFCESSLRAAGFRVGLHTSPHLVSVRERIQVDRHPISEADFAEGMELVRRAAEITDSPCTFFELITAIALWYFARAEVDWVVWETGLGGRLDATNIVTPEICIITNIGLDHQQYLGQSLREIALEKAGIIKPGVPVVSGVEAGEAADVIREYASAQGSPLLPVSQEVSNLGLRDGRQWARIDGREVALGLIGPHQVANAACALAALRHQPFSRLVSAKSISLGMERTVWSGRFEALSEKPLIVLDGAHNPAGVRKLVETWREFLSSREMSSTRTHLVFASVAEKDITEMAGLFRSVAREVSLVRLANERGAEPAALASHFENMPVHLYDSMEDLWHEITQGPPDVPILMAGSLFLAGEVLAQLHGITDEYRLNERFGTVTPVL